MDFLTLKTTLQRFKLELFSVNDIVKLTNLSKDSVRNKLSLLEKQQKIYRIKKGHYSLNKIENKFLLQKAFSETYIGLYSALEYYESTTQRFTNLDLITKKLKHNQRVQDTQIDFHKIKEELFFGYKKIHINNTELFISKIEKTLVDCIYFSNKVYLTEIREFIRKYKEEINKELLMTYLGKINSSTLNKRLGYLLEKEGIKLDLEFNNTYEKLNVNIPAKGKKNKYWKLIINEEV